jgi:hypothetical protein
LIVNGVIDVLNAWILLPSLDDEIHNKIVSCGKAIVRANCRNSLLALLSSPNTKSEKFALELLTKLYENQSTLPWQPTVANF